MMAQGSQEATAENGEVFTGSGSEVHKGLAVVNGAVIPRSLAANPPTTITSVAERSVERVAAEQGMVVDYDTKLHPGTNRKKKLHQPRLCGLVFHHEVLYCSIVLSGAEKPASLHLRVNDARANEQITGTVSGTVHCSALSQEKLMLHNGAFHIFEEDNSAPDQTRMTYDIFLIGTSGEGIHIEGIKVLNPSVALSSLKLWLAIMTVHLTLRNTKGSLLDQGTLQIGICETVNMLRSSEVGENVQDRRRLLLDFLVFFVSNTLHPRDVQSRRP